MNTGGKRGKERQNSKQSSVLCKCKPEITRNRTKPDQRVEQVKPRSKADPKSTQGRKASTRTNIKSKSKQQ